MEQKVSRNKSITYIIFAVCFVVLLCVWPFKLIRFGVTAKSDEIMVRESDPISVEYNLTQMFDGIGGRLESVDLYVVNDMSSQTMTFRLYDQEHKQVYEQFVNVDPDFVAPGFLNIPIRYDLIDKNEYSFIVEGLTQDLYLAYEDRTTTTSPVNFYMAYGGAEVPEYDVIVRYNVERPFTVVEILITVLILAVIAAAAFWILRKLKDKEVALNRVIRLAVNPLLLVGSAIVIYVTLGIRLFGPDTKNNLFITAGFLMLFAIVALWVNLSNIVIDIEKIKKLDIRKYLQIVSIATVLWYCYEYMNGLYDIFHYYSMCKFLIAFSFVLIFTFDKKELLNIPNAVWLVAGPIVGYFVAKTHAGEPEIGELYRLYGWLIAAGGFVVINIFIAIIRLIRKKTTVAKLSPRFLIPFGVLAVGMSILANTRYWVWILMGVCVLTVFRLAFWEKRAQFLENLCMGIILNFYMMVWFSANHRVFYYYQFYRYPMGYHTVTVTAYYLSLVICAAIVRLYCKSVKNVKPVKMIPQLFTVGMAGSFLLMTMSRTGFVSTGAVVLLFVLATTLQGKKGEKRKMAVKRFLFMAVAVIYMFPVTYALIDVCPRIANDPVTFEYEYREFTFEKGMPYSNAYYMTIEQFCREFGRKVFGIDPDKKEASQDIDVMEVINSMDPFVVKAYAQGEESQAEEFEEVQDISNGRFEIFRSYIKVWNLWGHEEMGAEMPSGEIAIHAHNTFLQVIHDHGLVIGIYFVIFMVYIFVLGLRRALKNRDGYEVLTPVLMTGFCAASMVEWILHLCNPFGFAMFLCILPLAIAEKEIKNEERN